MPFSLPYKKDFEGYTGWKTENHRKIISSLLNLKLITRTEQNRDICFVSFSG